MAETCTCHRTLSSDEDALRFDLDVARSALREGDLEHARHHVAGALGQAPTDARAHAVFEELASRADLTVGPKSGWYGEFAMVAFAQARAGRVAEALSLLAKVAQAAPHLGYEHVLTGWLARHEGRLDSQVCGALSSTFFSICESTIGLHVLKAGERALLGSLAGLASLVCEQELEDPFVLAPASGVLRRAGRLEEALAAARRAPGPPGRVQEGLALRAMGDGAKALAAFTAAAAEDGDPDGYSADQARCLFVAGEFKNALKLLGKQGKEDPEVEGLRHACRTPPQSAAARVNLLDSLRREARYIALERPMDATANMAADSQFRGAVKVAVSGWESPTNRLLLAVGAGHTDVGDVSYTMRFEDFERPVMRQVRGASSLWARRDGVVVQACPAPSVELRLALVKAARRHSAKWHEDLEALFAASRQMPAAKARELGAAMVYPPLEAAGDHLPEGVYRYQVACACAVTALPTDEGLAALEGIIFGPLDWASGAAVVALGEWVRQEPAVANRGRSLLIAAVDDLIPHQCEPRFWPLFSAFAHLPGVPERAHSVLKSWWKETHPKDEQEED